jgi:hypothetical protein
MKLFLPCFLYIIFCGTVNGQDNTDNRITKSYYNKWRVTYDAGDLFEYQRGTDVNGEGKSGVTILYLPQTMIDDGIYGSVGIMLTKEKKPEYILGLSFPIGIGNKSYEDLVDNDMNLRVSLMSGKDSVLKSVSFGSLEDQVTVSGIEFKGRLYRFLIDKQDFDKLVHRVPDKMQLYFKGKSNPAKPKRRPAGGTITSENAMISKFSSLAQSIEKVKVLEIQ